MPYQVCLVGRPELHGCYLNSKVKPWVQACAWSVYPPSQDNHVTVMQLMHTLAHSALPYFMQEYHMVET